MFGWLPDEVKSSDRFYQSSAASLPAHKSLLHLVPDILDQGMLQSCVACGLAQAVRMLQIQSGTAKPELMSRLFVYWHARNRHHAAYLNSGTYVSMALAVVNELGRPPERIWPYKEEEFASKPPPDTITHAHDFRATLADRILDGYDRRRSVIASIAENRPVLWGTLVDKSLTKLRSLDIVNRPTAYDGGHLMCVTGYSDNYVEVVNSWGGKWGVKGCFRASWDYVTWKESQLWSVGLR